MLLELITGKRPTDVIFQEGLTLHDWVRRHYPHDVGKIVAESWLTDAASAVADERLWNDVMVELIDLGIVCTQHSPPGLPWRRCAMRLPSSRKTSPGARARRPPRRGG